jgi:hypothetical protein
MRVLRTTSFGWWCVDQRQMRSASSFRLRTRNGIPRRHPAQ